MTSSMLIGILGFVVLLLLIFLRVWIGFALITVGFLGIALLRGFEYAGSMVVNEPFTQATNYNLTCMPLFCVMGAVICESGMGSQLYRCARAFLGHLRGGLGIATVAACGVFAAICGNSQVTAMTIGKISFPEMRKANYADTLAVGGIAAGGGIGIMIPPSVGFIVYGMITEQSIGRLFMAGIVPGLLLIVLYSAVYVIVAYARPDLVPRTGKSDRRERLNSLKDIWALLLLVILMLGGIYGGIFTATEAGAVGAVGAVIISAVTRKLTWKTLYHSIIEGARMTATVMILLIGAKVFLRFITLTGLAGALTDFIINLDVPRWVILFGVWLLYFIVGACFDIMAGIMLTVPFLYPVMTALGYDPIWFGVFVVAMMELGEITPPIGLSCFILSDVCEMPVTRVFKGVLPFIAAAFLFDLILCVFPKIALVLT